MLISVGIPVVLIIVIFLTLNFPIYTALFASSIYLQVFVNEMPLQSMFTTMFEALTKNSLLAIPFFIVAGNALSGSSLGKRLIDVFIALLKNVRAGLPISCLLANALFGAISGSPPAATATFSKIIHEPLSKAHGEKLSLGLITSAAGLSSIIPPSMVLIIYGVATDSSIADLFIAGILPGLVIVGVIGIYLFIVCKNNTSNGPTTLKEIITALWRSLPVLVLPILVLGGIYGGFLTPTEAGALSAAYTIVMGMFGLREIKFLKLLSILKDSVRTTGQIYILIAASTVFAQASAVSQIPQMLTQVFGDFSQFQFLIMLNIILLLVGCFIEPSGAILILAPMLLPVALGLGIDPVHLGIIFTVNLSIGMFTPPFGLNIFVCQSVLGKDMSLISRSIVPFIILYIIGLAFITYIPQISLILPSVL
jgi:C4-dicarboxylate transporter DctM subunit